MKSVALLDSNKLSEKGIKKMIPFTMASKTINYLGIKFTKEMKDLHSANDTDDTHERNWRRYT